jgi:uncharacterized repeat protein (TIGR04052 family)
MTRTPALAAMLLLACTGDKDEPHDTGHTHDEADADTDADADADTDTDADALFEVSLRFDAVVDGAPVACTSFPGLGGVETISIGDFRLYLSQIALLDPSGTAWPVTLAQDGLWQHEDVVLLDYEDASGSCVSYGTVETNDTVTGTVDSQGPFVGLRFDLGLPFSLNHADVTTAPSPLNLTSMFWGWQSGYKFVGIDLLTGDSAWFVHIGSTGCVSADPLSPPEVECALPNRARIRLEGGDPTTTAVQLDLARLLAGADLLSDAEGSPPGCMSFAMDAAECAPVFTNLGLDFATGLCAGGAAECDAQTAFGWSSP